MSSSRSVILVFAFALSQIGVTHAEPESPWGVSPSSALSRAPEVWDHEMVAAGVTSVRGFEARSDGSAVVGLRAVGLSVSGILIWSTGPEQTFPVNDLAGFRRYVIEQVTRYKGTVQHWEIWNEPPNFTKSNSPIDYGKIVAAAYDAAKSIDPTVQIGLCAKSVHIDFLAESIAGGARDKFDFISLHPYEVASLVPQGWEGPYLGIATTVRAMLREQDPGRVDVPIWFTEIGLGVAATGHDGVSPEVQADTLVKLYVMGIAQGVEHVHWFDPRDSEGLTLGLLRGDGSPRPAYRALATLIHALGRFPHYEGSVDLDPHTFGFLFQSEGKEALAAWSRSRQRGSALRFALPIEIVDLKSGDAHRSDRADLTQTPTLFVADSESAVAAGWRRRVKARLPSWDGAELGQTASLVAGEAPHGIHMANAPATETVHGRAEWNLTGTAGASFAVDPRFLNYASHPIRITAVVRGHGQGRPGFNLKYESRQPIA
ncbi:MAG TPA: hypothetical protein VGI70_20480, partial [Polyangiales bacterium]